MSESRPPCAALEEDLSALLDGELSGVREAELRAHVEACESCRTRMAAFQAVDASLRALEPTRVSDDLRARVRARLGAERDGEPVRTRSRPPRRRLRWLAVPAGLAAAAAAAAIALLWAPRWSEHPAATPKVAELPVERVIEQSSDEEIELALVLDTLGGLAPEDDLSLIEQLDVLEQLEQLDASEQG